MAAQFVDASVEAVIFMRWGGRMYMIPLDVVCSITLSQERVHSFGGRGMESHATGLTDVDISGKSSMATFWERAEEWHGEDPGELGSKVKGLLGSGE